MIKHGHILFVLLLLAVSCGDGDQEVFDVSREDYIDVLELRNLPAAEVDSDASCFFDHGAWHGFALPPASEEESWGGFPGPFLMSEWRWLSRGLAQLTLEDAESGREIDLREGTGQGSHLLPGVLMHELSADGMHLCFELAYFSSASALVNVKLINTSDYPRNIRPGWTGNLLMEGAYLEEEDGIVVHIPDSAVQYSLNCDPAGIDRVEISGDRRSYSLEMVPVKIDAGESISISIVMSLHESGEDRGRSRERTAAALNDPDGILKSGRERWNGYLSSIFENESQWLMEESYRRLAVKCLLTLVCNWKAPWGALQDDGVIPSYNIHYFNGFWAWDSWKHVAALAPVIPELAEDQLRAMLSAQDSTGMIADCVFPDRAEDNWRDTKPPLAAWAVYALFEETDDYGILEEFYPILKRYHRWWYKYRDHDGDGLCEYGSTDGTLIAARWESGMDNAARFDGTVMVRSGPAAWSMNQESVDLNSYLYAEKGFLAEIAQALGHEDEAADYESEARALEALIRKTMFDDETGYFYDIDLDSGEFIRVPGPEGWIPLWAGAASAEQARRVTFVMSDSLHFATYIPFPTLSRSHDEFSLGYWRGPVWLDQAYFAVRGLERYGYDREASVFIEQLLGRPEGLMDSGGPIYENYDPLTGKGLNVRHFSWSAAHLLMLLTGK